MVKRRNRRLSRKNFTKFARLSEQKSSSENCEEMQKEDSNPETITQPTPAPRKGTFQNDQDEIMEYNVQETPDLYKDIFDQDEIYPVGVEDDNEIIEETLLSPIEDQNDADSSKSYNPDEQTDDEETNERQKSFPIQYEYFSCLSLICGTSKITEKQYNNVYNIMNRVVSNLGEKCKFPSSTTARKVVRRLAETCLFASNTIRIYNVNIVKAGASYGKDSFLSSSTAPIKIVLPSSWAILDFYTTGVKNLIWNDDKNEETSTFSHPESCPIVRSRHNLLSLFRITDQHGNEICIEKGMDIIASCRLEEHILEFLRQNKISHKVSKENESLSFICYVKEAKLITGMDIRDENNNDSYRDPLNYRNGDLNISIKIHGISGTIISRSIVFERRGEFRQRMFFNSGALRCQFNVISIVSVKDAQLEVSVPANKGVLGDGRRYFVYRFMFYNDGFNPWNKQGSMDGCYMQVFGIPTNHRTPAGSIRRLWLAPPGCSSTVVFRDVINNIVEGTTKGFSVRDEEGDAVLFLDPVGYIADAPALKEMTDVRGHNAICPCHICSFMRRTRTAGFKTAYAQDPNQNSSLLSLRRTRERSQSIRDCGAEDDVLRSVGLALVKENNTAASEDQSRHISPLHELSYALENARDRVPMTATGQKVVPSIFDPYRSSIVSIDHVFLGLATNILDASVKILPLSERKILQNEICKVQQHHNLLCNRHILKKDQSGVRALQISEMYSIMLVSPSCFTALIRCSEKIGVPSNSSSLSIELVVSSLISKLQNLIACTMFVPDAILDSSKDWNSYHDCNGQSRLRKLRNLSADYLLSIKHACEKFPVLQSDLDKPNLHRLIEIYVHTIPFFRNPHHILELIFEKAHQKLKHGVKKSNNKNAQIQAMSDILADDWKSRLIWEISSKGLETGTTLSTKNFDWDVRKSLSILMGKGDLCEDLLQKLDGMGLDSLERLYKQDAEALSKEVVEQKWIAEGQPVSLSDTAIPSPFHSHHERLTTIVSGLENRPVTLKYFTSVKRMVRKRLQTTFQRSEICRNGMVFQINQLYNSEEVEISGDIIFNVLETNPLKDERRRSFYLSRFYISAVQSLPDAAQTIYIVSNRMDRYRGTGVFDSVPCLENHKHIHQVSRQHTYYLLKLSISCRSCLTMHACWLDTSNGNCVCSGENILHKGDITSGSPYAVKGRREGYPSRRG